MLSCLSWNGNPPSRTSYYSPMLHNAILSVAANYCEDYRLGTEDRGRLFAAKAVECIGDEGERPMLSTISALMLLASYHSGNAKHSLGYMYSGMRSFSLPTNVVVNTLSLQERGCERVKPVCVSRVSGAPSELN